jgi:hypothetical protein
MNPAKPADVALEVAGAKLDWLMSMSIVWFISALWHLVLPLDRFLALGETIGLAARGASAAPQRSAGAHMAEPQSGARSRSGGNRSEPEELLVLE